VRAYSAASEEAVHARGLLKDWAGEGFLSEAQYREMEPETVCDLRRTNIFLRLVFGFFTVIIALATVGLFFTLVFQGAGAQGMGVFLLVSAAVSYGIAESAVAEYRLYRYGIEEALLACAVGLLCGGVAELWSGSVPAVGTIASIWIWRRFGLPYAPLVAMLFVPWLAINWTDSQEGALARRLRGAESTTRADGFVGIVDGGCTHGGSREAILLVDVRGDLVPAAGCVDGRPAQERPAGDGDGSDHNNPDVRYEQALPRVGASHVGSDAAGRVVDRGGAAHSTLAREGRRRSSEWVYRSAAVG
jgi:hypothetical protein